MTESVQKQQKRVPPAEFVKSLVAVVLLINLFVAAQAAMVLRETHLQYQERAAVQAQNLAQALMYSMAGILDTVDVGLLAVADEAENEAVQGGVRPAAMSAFIARQYPRLPEVDSLRMAGPGGDILYGVGVVGAPKSVADRAYFKTLRDQPAAGLVISEPILGRISGKWVVILARRVNRPDGSFGGVVYAPLALERIRQLLVSIDVGSRGRLSLRDSKMGVIVRQPERADAGIGHKPTSSEMRRRLAAGMTSATFHAPADSGKGARVISYRRITRFPLFIAVVLDADDYLAPWWREVGRVAALIVLFMVVTAIFSRVILGRWRREKEAEGALRRSNEELELRVAERTAELSRANSQLTVELAARERAKASLRQSRKMLAEIVDNIPQAVFWKDRDSVFLGCNAVFARTLGARAPQELVGKSDFDFFVADEARAYRRDDREVMENNRPKYHIIEQVQKGDGSRLWADTTKVPLCQETGEVYGVLGVFDNITERRGIEEARDNALALLESILASSPAGIQVFDGKSGDCIMANESLAEMMGGTTAAMLTQNFRILSSWQETGADRMAEQVLADGKTRHLQRSFRTTFGKSVFFDCFFARCDVNGDPHLLFISLDSTEQKRLEEENRLIEAQMLHVQKLESLGVLAGGIAHDFNNILMVVLGNADLALMRLTAQSPAYDNLLQIEHAANRASELARQMLAYSGKGRFVIENLDLGKIVAEMAQMLDVSISKKVLLRYNFAAQLASISGDATQLRQVVLNLVINASEAIGDQKGVITVSTTCTRCDRAYLSESWIDDHLPEGEYVVLEVSDTGCGIDREIIPKIFDPFFTTKFTGRGLGMAAVLGIVRGHRGAIKIYSEKGKGTTFRMLFPALAVAADLQLRAAVEPLWQGSGTLLLVDDEASILTLGQDMLQELGFRVLTAPDGRSALDIFARHQGEIVCVLLDLTMPDLDGEQTFQELRRMKPDVRVIISSGYNEQEVSEKFVGRGLAGFIQKPYKLVAVSHKLREILA